MIMPIIDADAHLIEGDQTWSFMLPEERHLVPEKLISEKTGIEFWRFEDRVLANSNLGLNVPAQSRDMTDVVARLKHTDALGIDVQVLYPTLFLRPTTARADVELAIYRGYNRWLAHIWRLGNNRLRWVVLPPLRSMNEAIDEINFGKEQGACGVFMRGHEEGRLLSDASLFPLYKEAERLDLPICIHAGTGDFGYYHQYGQDVFSRFKLPSVGAFNNLIYQGIPAKFPKLRWCFVETTAQWLPYAINDLLIRTDAERAFQRNHAGHVLTQARPKERNINAATILADNRVYVACQTTDDLAYVANCVGEDHIIVGTDYGHADYSNDIEAFQTLAKNGSISASFVKKILGENAKKLYGL